jgi:hypothetical protein
VSKLVGIKLAAEKGSDGRLRATTEQTQFASEEVEHDRELALGR